jgi:two-component system, NarL family, response regulator NreC
MAVRVLIADDHGLIRAGLRSILEDEPAVEVVGEAVDGVEAVRLALDLQPDIVLMDIGMPGLDGIDAARQLKQSIPATQLLILSVYEDLSFVREAIKAGAAGYIIKRAVEEELIEAIHAVHEGNMYVHPALLPGLLKDPHPSLNNKIKGALDELTPREVEVMGYIVRGYTNKQIAGSLYISTRTVEGHRASLLGKLGLKNRVDLVEFAEKHGLLDR